MGYGGYSSDAHAAITRTRSVQTDAQIFEQTGKGADSRMDPKGLKFRESRDSATHPRALPIVFCLDQTGSMNDIPKDMAKNDLPGFMQSILDQGVEDPQVLFMAVGDMTNRERAPVQIGQFESESEAQLMDQWLTLVDLVGNGGGNGGESYELAAYTIARHTQHDHYEKRGLKGYVFMTGDDAAFPEVRADQVRSLLGDDLRENIRTEEIFRELREKYEVFFIIPAGHDNHTAAGWRTLLGDHVIQVEGKTGDTNMICTVAAAIVALNEGKVADLTALAKSYAAEGMDRKRVADIVRALTPFAETLQRAGVPDPEMTDPNLQQTGRGTREQTRGLS